MYVLGISCYYHDAAACLLKDGVIVAAAEEERFSRRKHDARFPSAAIAYCLESAGIGPGQVDHVAFYEKPLLRFERILSSTMDAFPRAQGLFVRAMQTWLREKLWVRSAIEGAMGGRRDIAFGEHHLSHAASAFLVSPYEDAAVLTADGVGEWTTTAVGVGTGTSLELLREIRFPHSLGLFYSAFTAFLGFEVNEGEYKVMGLAAYGRPRFADLVRRVIDLADDGSYRLDLRYFAHHRALRSFDDRLASLLGPPRRDGEPIEERHADIAASVQLVLEEAMLRIATELRRTSGLPRLCMAGGVALNGLANARILREAGFDEIFVQPAAGDSGGAIGAATYLYHTVLGHPRVAGMRHAYLGPEYGPEEVAGYLASIGVAGRTLDEATLVEEVAELIARGRVVGWFRGRMEFGPRALGARSILADPRRAEMKDLLNEKIKHREQFRPFAPSVTVEDASRFFALRGESPYMLQIVPVREEWRARIPAVTHVDGTARVQTVSRDVAPAYYDLLRAFERRSGVPVLVNTSLNVRGEPIVESPADAYRCFVETDMDHLVLGNVLLDAAAKRRGVTAAARPAMSRPELAL